MSTEKRIEELGERLEAKGKAYGEFKPISIRRFTWQLHKLLFKVAIFAGIVAYVSRHG
jgi:hypothetical protein